MASARSVEVAWREKNCLEATGVEPAYSLYCRHRQVCMHVVSAIVLLSYAHTFISTQHQSPRGYTTAALLSGENKKKSLRNCTPTKFAIIIVKWIRRLGNGSIYMPAQLREAKQQREGVGEGGMFIQTLQVNVTNSHHLNCTSVFMSCYICTFLKYT